MTGSTHNVMSSPERILIIGGTGSLGGALTRRLLDSHDEVWLYSRDECKHWSLALSYGKDAPVHFVIGDIADADRIGQTLRRYDFHTVILAAAMKHIDKCEFDIQSCLATLF